MKLCLVERDPDCDPRERRIVARPHHAARRPVCALRRGLARLLGGAHPWPPGGPCGGSAA